MSHRMTLRVLALLLALPACGPASTSSSGNDDTAGGAPPDTAGDTAADTGTDTGAAPGLDLLAPTAGATMFVGVRYDLVAVAVGAESVTAVVTGATSACEPFDGEVLHCALVAGLSGPVDVEVTATAGNGRTTFRAARAEARPAAGVVPRGDQFALGMYEVMDEGWFAPLEGSGVNVVQSYGTGGYTQEAWQEWARAGGFQTMTRPSWSWQDPWGEPSSDETLAWLAARTELAWWELPDMPVDDTSQAEELHAVVDRIRSFDDRPTYVYLWTSMLPESIAPYLDDVDVLAPGTYPEHACQPQPWIRWRIETVVQAAADAGYTPAERPVVGTSDLYSRPEASCPELQSELPQVRMNPLAMIAAGARGVNYFAWYYAQTSLDPAWAASALATADLINGESGLGYAVVHGESLGTQPVGVVSGPDNAVAFTPLYTDAPIVYPSLHAAAWTYAGTRFVVAVNYTEESVTADLGGFPTRTTRVEVVGEDRTLESGLGEARDSFEPWGAHVYRAPILEP